jgi:hypothetical protein
LREVVGTYGFPIVMFALAIIPGFNFTYSGHGGISWFVVPLCFPWVVLRALIKIVKGSEASRTWYKGFFKITIPSYIALALPLSWAATTSISNDFRSADFHVELPCPHGLAFSMVVLQVISKHFRQPWAAHHLVVPEKFSYWLGLKSQSPRTPFAGVGLAGSQ